MPDDYFIELYQKKSLAENPLEQAGRGADFDIKGLMLDFQGALEAIKVEKQHIVLDVGCANGLFDIFLSACCKKLVCVEPVHELRQKAEYNLKTFDNVGVVDGHASNIPLSAESVDRVLMLQVLQLIPDSEVMQVFEEVERVMKNGARAAFCSIPNAHKRSEFLKDYISGIETAIHISERQKHEIISRNERASWYYPEKLIEICTSCGLTGTIKNLPENHADSAHRYHLVATKG